MQITNHKQGESSQDESNELRNVMPENWRLHKSVYFLNLTACVFSYPQIMQSKDPDIAKIMSLLCEPLSSSPFLSKNQIA